MYLNYFIRGIGYRMFVLKRIKYDTMKTGTIHTLLAALAIMIAISANAQGEKWTLNRCIEYARANNLQVKNAALSKESSAVTYKESKSQQLPSLSFSSNQSLVNEKQPNSSGTYVNSASYSGTYGLSSSMTLYNGGKVRTNISQKSIALQQSDLELQAAQNSIEVAVTQAYLQVLYANETLKSNRKTLESSEATMHQSEELLKAGSISQSDYAQLVSQYSNDKYQVTLGENDLAQAKLTLKQLLELGPGESIDLEFPEINDAQVLTPIPTSSEVYGIALASRPEIQSSKYSIDMSNLDLKKAYADRLPTVSLNASMGTGNYSKSDYTLYNQLNNSFNQSVGITIGIPIFKNRSVRSNIERTSIQVKQAELSYSSAEKDLLKAIEDLYLNASSGQSKYLAAKDKLKSAQMSLDLVQAQFKAGMKNTVELLTEKNNYSTAEIGLIQAKYQSVLSMKLLNFYQNKPITL